ncbi:polynucleotide kinase-phosphatase [Deinococcus piscis]|uniref:Polynucleotide kinase-phosphatase n=1 Tax=Deinococcus piscis TaxID=394230 RepID=A0ABQ3KAA6_9DEIO|nr:polynucleotide kinase-phosphatase [Deinococcus piscis]GHG10492.1 polynucleotide kinase-phosphatase [Deinococcus piscis]
MITTPTTIQLPAPALVLLMGASSAGKSSFAARHFKPTEVLSSDHFRALVSDDETDGSATADAFELLYALADKRLARGLLTVIDATHVRAADRKRAIALARAHDLLAVGIVLDLPLEELLARHAERRERDFAAKVIQRQQGELRRGLRGLAGEGLRHVWTLRSEAEAEAAQLERTPLFPDRRELRGPFDFIGDVHGCREELETLLESLGYLRGEAGYAHPEGRRAVFVGDLIDRGPDSVGVLQLVMDMVQGGAALAVPGNHDDKLAQALKARGTGQWPADLGATLEQLSAQPAEFQGAVRGFLSGMVSHLVLDEGRVVVAHAGLPERYQGRASARVRSFALYGDVDGSVDAAGLPLRRDWAAEYDGAALVVYGHTPVAGVRRVRNTVNIDTGCVFGGSLTALRYPEGETVSVPAAAIYAAPPASMTQLAVAPTEAQPAALFDLATFFSSYTLDTRAGGQIRVPAASRPDAVSVYSMHGVDPRLCAYLPPTMSPVATSPQALELGLLEHPAQAFNYFRKHGVETVICQEKHMGSRAVLLLCRDEAAAQRRFGDALAGTLGTVYTRTGQRFFASDWEHDVLTRTAQAATQAGLWDSLSTDWLLLDTELLPWSLKAEELIREQYAAVGAAGLAGLSGSTAALAEGVARGLPLKEVLERTQERLSHLEHYRAAYRRYVRRSEGPQDVQFRPFHLLAAEGQTFFEQSHLWHLQKLAELSGADPQLFGKTAYQLADLSDPSSVAAATGWWTALTAGGGEGMVVKPLDFLPPRGVQPALKVRGPEYLRMIYGPEYTRPSNLIRLLERALKGKRTRALQEFRLGLEGLERLAAGDRYDNYHPYALGVLALEQGRMDARL